MEEIMHRLRQILITAIFLVFLHAAWQPANAASYCAGLDCEVCENDLNRALLTAYITTPLYTQFLCGHGGGGMLSVAFSDTLTRVYADYDGGSRTCMVFADPSTGENILTEAPLTDRQSINAWKAFLREQVCSLY